MSNDPLIKVSELASRYGLARETLYGKIRAGLIPVTKLGPRTIRVRESDFRRYIDQANEPAACQG